MLLGRVAPILPVPLIPIVMVAFSAISTCGALYYTVVKRLRRQYELNAEGQLSRLNRKWMWKLVGFLLLFLASAFFFLLEAPKWDALEWALTWAAIPIYFAVFLFAEKRLKKEFGPRFYKARAMKWSFWIVGVALCIAYAALSLLLPSADYSSLSEAYQLAPKPFEGSPSALMDEVGELSSLMDGIVSFGIARASEAYGPIAFICKFVVYASVFFGLVNQFGFCLLNMSEIKSEFQLLPAHDERIVWEWEGRSYEDDSFREAVLVAEEDFTEEGTDDPHGEILARYIIAVAVVLVASIAIFLGLNYGVEKMRETEDYTAIEQFVNDTIATTTFVVDGALEQYRTLEDYRNRIHELEDERNEGIAPLLDEY